MKNAGLALDCRCHFRPITDNDRESLGFVDCSDQGIAAGPRRPLFLQKSPHIMQVVEADTAARLIVREALRAEAAR